MPNSVYAVAELSRRKLHCETTEILSDIIYNLTMRGPSALLEESKNVVNRCAKLQVDKFDRNHEDLFIFGNYLRRERDTLVLRFAFAIRALFSRKLQ